MIAVGEFMQDKIGHPSRLGLEITHVSDLHALGHRRITSVVTQPARAGMIFRSGLYPGIRGRKPQRDLAQLRHRRSRNHANYLLQLHAKKFERLLRRRLVLR